MRVRSTWSSSRLSLAIGAATVLLAGAASTPSSAEPPPAFTMFGPGVAQGGVRSAGDALPIIVSYELKRQRDAARIIARNPKAFWVRQIVARIESKKLDLSKPVKEPVVVEISFVVGRNGRIVSKAISKGSGLEEADKTAIAMLERAQPFPPMPATMEDRELSFSLPVRFR